MGNANLENQLEQIPKNAQKYIVRGDQNKRDIAPVGKVEHEFIIPLEGFGKGAAKPTAVNAGVCAGYGFSINDLGYFSFEVPRDWKEGTDIEIGIHWYIDETGAVQVQWAIIWLACAEDGTEDPTAAGATIESGDVTVPGTANLLVETDIHLPGASLSHHDVVLFQVKRIAAVGTDPTAEPVIVSLEAEYTQATPKGLEDLTAFTTTLVQDLKKQKITK